MSLKDIFNSYFTDNTTNNKIVFEEEADITKILELFETISLNDVKNKISYILKRLDIFKGIFEIYYCDNTILVDSKEQNTNLVLNFESSNGIRTIKVLKDLKEYNFEFKDFNYELISINDFLNETTLHIETSNNKTIYKINIDNTDFIVSFSSANDSMLREKNKIQEYLLKLKLPVELLKLYEDIIQLTNKNISQFGEFRIVFKNYLEDDNFIISDTLHFQNGNLLILKRTVDDCITTIRSNGNWSYSSPEIELMFLEGTIYSKYKTDDKSLDIGEITQEVYNTVNGIKRKKISS